MLRWLFRNAGHFDVGHLHLGRDLIALSAGLMFLRANVPYTTQTHGMIAPDSRAQARLLDRLLTLRILRRAKSRFVLTRTEKQDIQEMLGDETPTVQLPNGVALTDLRPRPEGRPDVVFMARLHPRKRVMDFAEAARNLIADGIDADSV